KQKYAILSQSAGNLFAQIPSQCGGNFFEYGGLKYVYIVEGVNNNRPIDPIANIMTSAIAGTPYWYEKFGPWMIYRVYMPSSDMEERAWYSAWYKNHAIL